jgi:cytoskeletal protein CcmA (bactofilin family)
MFKNKEILNTESKLTDSGSINTIVNGTTIEGTINTAGNIRFDGVIRGKIESRGKVVIGTTGVVNGDIICTNADISGKIQGNIKCKEMVSLKAGSQMNGDILTGKLSIEPGAIFTGKCNMSNQPEPQHEEPSKVAAQ